MPVAVVDSAVRILSERVLHVVQVGLLEICVVENVKCFREKFQAIAFPDLECPRQIEVHVADPRPTESIEFFTWYDGEIDFRVVKHRGVRPAAGKIQDTAKLEALHVAMGRRPNPGRNKSLRLVELRWPSLRSLIELVEVTGPLIGDV